jgi:hypothetical protein
MYEGVEVKISWTEYQRLVDRDEFLTNLEAAGVDSWDGYHYGYGLEEADPEDR